MVKQDKASISSSTDAMNCQMMPEINLAFREMTNYEDVNPFVALNMMCVRKLKWCSDIRRASKVRRLLACVRPAVDIACANKRLS